MSLYHSENATDNIPTINNIEHYDERCAAEMSSLGEKNEAEFHLANESIVVSPRSARSGASSSEVFTSHLEKLSCTRPRPKSARTTNVRSSIIRPSPSSSIPLPVKSPGPIKVQPLLKNAKSVSRTISTMGRSTSLANKHTLEIQFINKNKRFVQMRRELLEKQKPIMDLYHNLSQLKSRLEELGRSVKLEEVKLVYFEDCNKKLNYNVTGSGEQVSLELVDGMKSSIEEIPKTLMDICKNLLSRRALIVELLESVTKSEVDVDQVSDKIESLKQEGDQLQQSLDAVMKEHESKITELVSNWQKLLNDKQCLNMDSKIDELENKLKDEQRLREESALVIHELHEKLNEKKISHEKSLAELNQVLQALREQVKKLEQDLESERKIAVDFKTRNNTNSQSLKSMRAKISELENEKKETENSNSELQKKIKSLQDQLKCKESHWTKEKDEMNKSLKHQENLLQKLTADKNQFETRLEGIENAKKSTENELQTTISSLKAELQHTVNQMNSIKMMRDEAISKCSGFESYIARMGAEFKETMYKVSCSVEWGKSERQFESPAIENYMQEMAKDLRIRELEDKIYALENEQQANCKRDQEENEIIVSSKLELQLKFQQERVKNYELLLEDSENKLRLKLHDLRSMEVAKLESEIRQLRVRQEALEEQNEQCASKELQRMLNDGREKLNKLMKKSLQNDSQLEEYKSLITKQKIQMNEMDNLLRYRENMANVLKSSRNDLLLEKESLARYSREARAALAEVTNESLLKESIITSLREKLGLRENQLRNLESAISELEEKLQITNRKRYKLQETVGSLEQELQKCQAKVKQLTGAKDNGGNWRLLDSVCEAIEDKKPNKQVAHCCNNLVEKKKSKLHFTGYYEDTSKAKSSQSSNIYRKKISEVPKRKRRCFKNVEYPNSLQSFEVSSNNVIFENNSFKFSDKTSSIHANCHHGANSRSLISMSLQSVDVIKAKLNFLASLNTPLSETICENKNNSSIIETSETQTQINSTQTQHIQGTASRNLDKIMELTSHRYKYLHNQAQDSYDELSKLVKIAVTRKDSMDK